MLGSSRNWTGTGKALGELFHVHAVDLPNHGHSPRMPRAPVAAMAASVLEWMDAIDLDRVTLMGHSLGGKVAMRLAVDHAPRVERLFVLDIAPKAYPVDSAIPDALLALDLSRVGTRAEAEAALEPAIPSQKTRWFLLTNLSRQDDGSYAWDVPLETIRDHMAVWNPTTLGPGDVYAGPTLFVAGGRSDYLTRSDFASARAHFPHAELVVLPDVGHNVHIDGGQAFLDAVRNAVETA